MGSPVFPIVCNILMEHLEQLAIAAAPQNCISTLWLRYVDDCLATEQLNWVNCSCSIKFTNQQIPFLDGNIIKTTDGKVKTTVFGKSTHTNQYLQFRFMAMYPLIQKLGLVHTLIEHCQNIITDSEDQTKEKDVESFIFIFL